MNWKETVAAIAFTLAIVGGVAWLAYHANGRSHVELVLQHRDVIVYVENGQLVAKWLEEK